MDSPTLSDVARTAGVSYATADRVINQRGNVAEKSIRKVREAMVALGYVRNVAAANLSRGRVYRLAFLLPQGRNAFFALMRGHLENLAGHLSADRVQVDIIDVPTFEAEALSARLDEVADAGFDGVAVVGLSSPRLAAPLERLRAAGVPLVGLVSDLPHAHRAAYIGIDNISAGRTAARLVGLSHGGAPGRVLVLAGSLEAQDHAERLRGFAQVLETDFPALDLMDTAMTHDMPDQAEAILSQALQADAPPSAIYNVGAGTSGVIAALQAAPRPARLFCAVHELVPGTRQALRDGTLDLVIDQRPDVEVTRACTILKALIDERTPPPMPDLVPMIYVRDNLPGDPVSPTQKDPMP